MAQFCRPSDKARDVDFLNQGVDFILLCLSKSGIVMLFILDRS